MKASLPELLINGPGRTNCTLVLAHGAGAPMDTEFMNAFAESLADRGLRVVRFEFPYMAERRRSGKRRAPDRASILLETWLQVLDSVHADTLVIGGKSMGGRIASLIADDASFKSEDWTQRVAGPFDCVVSMQAVHELRHKRHAPRLYRQVYGVLAVPGLLMVCDHTPFDDSPRSTVLYMTPQEQQGALVDSGFVHVHVELEMGSLVLYVGERVA